ncbi:hypothetical protein [Mycoplasma sp. P36-A1]|uniref:hypothetical protein n=1 Tax=Mycoplasma sp. P36-A1 TaxID=3252900 RepID=UPI003C2E10E5
MGKSFRKQIQKYKNDLNKLKYYEDEYKLLEKINDNQKIDSEVLHKMLYIRNRVGILKNAIDNLNEKPYDKDKEIFECIYLKGYSRENTAYLLGYSVSGIDKRIVIINDKLSNHL